MRAAAQQADEADEKRLELGRNGERGCSAVPLPSRGIIEGRAFRSLSAVFDGPFQRRDGRACQAR